MKTAAEALTKLTGAKSIRAIAATTGLDNSTLTRQLTGKSTLAIETVVTICRSYALDLSEAFVAVGFITPTEAETLGRTHSLTEYTDLELAQEIVRRLEAATAGPELTEPLAPVTVGKFGQMNHVEERKVAHPALDDDHATELMDE